MRVKSPVDLAAGLMFAFLGAAAVFVAADYPAGTLRRMGPGLLPLILGSLLALAGLALAVQSLVADVDEEAGELNLPGLRAFRAALFVSLGLLAFALLIRPAGLFAATTALVLISTRAERGYPWLGAIVLAPCLAALSAAIFVYGLGLPFRVWP